MIEEIPLGLSACLIPKQKFSIRDAAAYLIIGLGPAWMLIAAIAGAEAIYRGHWEAAIQCWSVLSVPLTKR